MKKKVRLGTTTTPDEIKEIVRQFDQEDLVPPSRGEMEKEFASIADTVKRRAQKGDFDGPVDLDHVQFLNAFFYVQARLDGRTIPLHAALKKRSLAKKFEVLFFNDRDYAVLASLLSQHEDKLEEDDLDEGIAKAERLAVKPGMLLSRKLELLQKWIDERL